MKKFLMSFVTLLVMSVAAFAQADRIVGTYATVHDGVSSKVKISKVGNAYRAQVIWVDNLKKEDGSIRTDEKNPDAAKRSTPANKIVLVEKVTYNEKKNQWDNGKIYEPTSGKTWTVTISFKDEKTLKVRGSFGPIGKSVYWTKLD
ncbi:MAG: DUF2147 domain-containing protein [Bacteroidaceae bacterium]|nr:DUF2147 domain-containing protein [Bacteroidaceae bacterium]